MAGSAHEDYQRHAEIRLSSDRSFGFVFAAFFTVVALWPLLRGRPLRWWALAPTALFLAITLIAPSTLHPLNVLWGRLGVLLSRIVSPIVLGAMFFLIFTPGAILFRLFGKDFLRVKRTAAESYWLRRTPPGPAPETVINQF